MARIVVVGAGVGGLAVAARLAAQRHDVTLCERSEGFGGTLGAFTRDGFTFTTGPGVLTLPAVYRDLFLKTGASLEDTVDLVEVSPAARCVFAGRDGAPRTVVDIPNASRSGTAAAFDEAFGPGAGAEWNRLISRAGEMWGVIRPSLVEAPLLAEPQGRAERLRSHGGARALRTTARWRSLRSLARGHLRDPRLRAYLERFAAEAGSDPRRAPATTAVAAYLEQTFGLWYVRGGLKRMTDALAERCASGLGVTMLAGTEVEAVRLDGGRAAGVDLVGGGRIDADAVVTDVPAHQLYGRLLPRPRELARTRATPPASSVFELHLALRGTGGPDGQPMPHRTHLFPDDPAAEPAGVFGDRPAPPADPLLCVLAPGDPGHAPEGHEGWTVQVRVPRQGERRGDGSIDWTAPGTADGFAQHVLGLMASRGLDVRDRMLWHEVRTPADVAGRIGSPDGAVPGSGADAPRQALRRLPNRGVVPQLFSVGADAHPGGGLTRVGMSAAVVAELIGRA